MRAAIYVILSFCAATAALSAEPAASRGSDLSINPQVLEVTSFFAGGRVTISGKIPSSQDAAVEVIGPQTSGLYDVKGRVGPFWMTRGKVRFKKAPSLYILLLPADREWAGKAAELGLDLGHLKSVISIDHEGPLSSDLFRMFVNFKSSEGLYGERTGAVSYSPSRDGLKRFEADCLFPSSTAGGRYQVKVTTVEQGRPVGHMTGEFAVREIGFTRFVHDLAFHQGLVYGVFSVLTALFAGALMGLLFKRGGGSH